jgi:hypothetical protein
MNSISNKQANAIIGLGVANAFLTAKTNKSLSQIRALEAENLAAQEEANQISRATVYELSEQNQLLQNQELDRAKEKQKKIVQLALKDLIFCLNEELDTIESTSSELAESFFRSKSLSSVLDGYDLSSKNFEEISDKTYWSNLKGRIKRIQEDALNANDKNLKKFIPLVNALFSLGERPEVKDFSKREAIHNEKIEFHKSFLKEFFYKNGQAKPKTFLPWGEPELVPEELWSLFAPSSFYTMHGSQTYEDFEAGTSFARGFLYLLSWGAAAAMTYFLWWDIEELGIPFYAMILFLLLLPIGTDAYGKEKVKANSAKNEQFDIIQKSIAASEGELAEIDNKKKLESESLTEFAKNQNDIMEKILDFSDIYPFIIKYGITTQNTL